MRTELLEQHAELRTIVDRVRLCAVRPGPSTSVTDDLASTIRLLADALHRHNLREEELLRDFVATVDAWGEARAEIMTDRHAREHAALHGALVATCWTPSAVADEALALLLDEILKHMTHEEEAFLNERVLRDDFVATDSFGG
jgi:hypothetical protein